MTQMPAADVPGMGRRQFMNLPTFGSVTGVALGALYPVVSYFIPPRPAGSGGGTSAKDELGNAVTLSGWLNVLSLSARSTNGVGLSCKAVRSHTVLLQAASPSLRRCRLAWAITRSGLIIGSMAIA